MDQSKRQDYWRKANEIAKTQNPDTKSGDFEYPFFLLRQKDYDAAMAASKGGGVFILPNIMAMLGMPNEEPKAYLEERWAQHPAGLEPRLMLVAAWYLCGETRKAQLLAERLLELQSEESPELDSQETVNTVLKYYAGNTKDSMGFLDLSEDASDLELLAGVFVAFRLIGEGDPGDRADAKRLAQRAFDNSGTYFTRTLSHTMIKLLEDSNWPLRERQ